MRSAQAMITPKEIYCYASAALQPYLDWQDRGPKCTVTTLLHILFYTAAQLCSLASACARLRDAPSDQAARDALVALCGDADRVERQLNESFAAQLPHAVVRTHEMARLWKFLANKFSIFNAMSIPLHPTAMRASFAARAICSKLGHLRSRQVSVLPSPETSASVAAES